MPNAIGITNWEKLCFISHHRLVLFPFVKGTFPTMAETFLQNGTAIASPPRRFNLQPLPKCFAC